MPDALSGDFELQNGVLKCPLDMNAIPPKDLRAWCDKLLESPQSVLAIDMSGTRHIASHQLGVIAQAWAEAVARNKELVVRISPDMRRVFEMSGLDQVFELTES
jgi:anti-anti-sigma factor